MLLVSPSRWWIVTIQGALLLCFGVFVLAYNDLSSSILVILFASLITVQGLIALIVALRERRFLQHWWMSGIISFVNLSIAVFMYCYMFLVGPLSQDFLSVFMGIQALVQGSMAFGISLEMHRESKVQGAFLFYGVLSIIGGILVLTVPYTHTVELLYLIAVYALLAGVGLALDSLRLRHMIR